MEPRSASLKPTSRLVTSFQVKLVPFLTIFPLSNVKDTGFDLSLQGSVLNTGPLDALITFLDPINVNWNGQDIATIALPPICATANAGVPDYKSLATLTITNQAGYGSRSFISSHFSSSPIPRRFTAFATYILHNPSFTWTISSPTVRVEALNVVFDNVLLTQQISFAAFNNLPGVTISNFNLVLWHPVFCIQSFRLIHELLARGRSKWRHYNIHRCIDSVAVESWH